MTPAGDAGDRRALVIDRFRRLPKAELHVHLDGSLRPATMLELAGAADLPMPASDPSALRAHMVVADGASLEEYLERFEISLSVMQDVGAIGRIAYELAADHAAENVRYVEVRFCPLLNTDGGLTPAEAVEAALDGLRRAEADFDMRTGVIVCALRSFDPARSLAMADLAIRYRERGVCGFDLAGAESGHPVRAHAEAFDRVAAAGVPITIHAGEGFGAESIRQAVEVGHATRIGHGTRLREDPELLDVVRERRIPLEVCLTSNVQTGTVDSLYAHPARDYHVAGIPVTLSTDNRLMSGVSLTDEYEHAHQDLGFTWAELVALARAGFEHAFVPPPVRDELLAGFDAEVAAM